MSLPVLLPCPMFLLRGSLSLVPCLFRGVSVQRAVCLQGVFVQANLCRESLPLQTEKLYASYLNAFVLYCVLFDDHLMTTQRKFYCTFVFSLQILFWPLKGRLTVFISYQVTTPAANRRRRRCGRGVMAGARDPTRRPPSLHPQAGIPPPPQEPTSISTPGCSVTSQCTRCVLILKKNVEDMSPFLF